MTTSAKTLSNESLIHRVSDMILDDSKLEDAMRKWGASFNLDATMARRLFAKMIILGTVKIHPDHPISHLLNNNQ